MKVKARAKSVQYVVSAKWGGSFLWDERLLSSQPGVMLWGLAAVQSEAPGVQWFFKAASQYDEVLLFPKVFGGDPP